MTNLGWDDALNIWIEERTHTMDDIADAELHRLYQLEGAVAGYLAHITAYENGSTYDRPFALHWRSHMEELVKKEVE